MPWAVGSWARRSVANKNMAQNQAEIAESGGALPVAPALFTMPWANKNVAQGHAHFAGTCGFLREIEQKAAGLRQTAAQPCATGIVEGVVQGAIGGGGLVAGIVQDQIEVVETVAHPAVEKTEAYERWR